MAFKGGEAVILSIDLETYSGTQLKGAGVYRYSEDPDFEVLLFAYAFDDQPVQVIDIKQGEQLPSEVVEALTDPNVTKSAFNANFERITINRHFGIPTPPEQWQCTMVHSMMLGLPASLDGDRKSVV